MRRKRLSVDIGGAADPIILKRKLRNESHIILDPADGNYDYSLLKKAKKLQDVRHVKQALTEEKRIPAADKSVNEIDCRQVYNRGKIISPELVAKEAARTLVRNGRITISGRNKDKTDVINAFVESGFAIKRSRIRPVTKFEKFNVTIAMENWMAAKKRARELARKGASKEDIEMTMKIANRELELAEKEIFVARFRKK